MCNFLLLKVQVHLPIDGAQSHEMCRLYNILVLYTTTVNCSNRSYVKFGRGMVSQFFSNWFFSQTLMQKTCLRIAEFIQILPSLCTTETSRSRIIIDCLCTLCEQTSTICQPENIISSPRSWAVIKVYRAADFSTAYLGSENETPGLGLSIVYKI